MITQSIHTIFKMKNMYSAKCLEGNWYNDHKLTTFEGVRPIVQTETQIRQAESKY